MGTSDRSGISTGSVAPDLWTGRDTASLLATVMGCSRRQAARCLQEAGSLRGLGRWASWSCLGPERQRQRLLAMLELARRSVMEGRPRVGLEGPAALAAWFADLALLDESWTGVAVLDGGGQLVAEQRMTGRLQDLDADLGRVFRPAVVLGAPSIGIVHSRACGVVVPGPAEVRFCQRSHAAAILVGLNLVDVVLLGGGRWQSLRAAGCLERATP